MKKVLWCAIISFFIISLLGCSAKNKEAKDKAEKKESNTFQIKAAENLVKNYMNYLVDENYEDAVKIYADELKDQAKITKAESLKIKGYKISEINEVGKSGVFKVRVTRTDMNSALSILDEYSIKVIKDITDYKINEIKCSAEKEAFVEYDGIRLKDKNNIETKLVIDTAGIPTYAFAQDDTGKTNKIKVPKKSYGRINFSYEGEKLGITTYEEDSFIGIVNIDESLAVQGNGNKQDGEEGKDDSKEMITREKPIGKDIISLDLLEDSIVDFVTFSIDEKFLVAQYKKNNEGKCIRVYKCENGDIIPVVFENEYPVEDVDVIFTSFDEDVLNFEVIKKEGTEEPLENVVGKWQLDLKKFKVKKL